MSNHNIDGVLVKLSIRRFQNSKKDKKITDEVVEERSLGEEAGSWRKQKFPSEALAEIVTLTNKTRSWHYANSLPWDDGRDLVTNAFLAQYENGLVEARNELGELVAALCRRYDYWIEKAREMHNGEFDIADYPTQAQLAEKFSISWEILPIPQSSALAGLVEKLGEKRAKELQTRLDAANNRRMSELVHDVWARVLNPLISIASQLTSEKACFKSNLLDPLRNITSAVPNLNITNDPRLIEMTKEIEAMLDGLSPEALRGSQVLANATAAKALNILNKFGDGGSRSFV